MQNAATGIASEAKNCKLSNRKQINTRREPTDEELTICPKGARLIPLPNGRFTIVDSSDYEWLLKWKWALSGNGYVTRNIPRGFTPSERNGYIVGIHRLILNTPKGFKTDHINGNPLDNRRENLRIASNSQNLCNRGRPRNNKSGFKGVCKCSDCKSYHAQITFKGVNHTLGYFKTALEAHEAYKAAALRLHGEFANTGA